MQNLLSHNRRPDLTFHKSGRIDISARVVGILNLRPGDVVSIARENDGFFLFIVARCDETAPHFSYSGRCFSANKASSSLRTQSRILCGEMLRASRRNKVAKLPVGDLVTTPVGMALPIITQNALNYD